MFKVSRPWSVVYLLALLVAPICLAADTPAPDQKPKSPQATAAITRAQKDEAAAAEMYRATLLGIKRAELMELKAAQANALKGGTAGLDEANRIGAEIKRVEGEMEGLKGGTGGTAGAPTKEGLAARLEGSRWKFGEWQVTFGRGTYAFSNWDKQGTWAVISPQTIECHEPWGKTKRWIFDLDLTVTTEFEGQHVIGSSVRIEK